MTNNQKRDIATSLTTLIFLVVGITGVLMFFHLFDKYTKELHEILGLGFVAVVVFHVIFNFKSMKQYFSKKVFMVSAGIIVAITLGFILNSSSEAPNPKRVAIDTLLNGNLKQVLVLFNQDTDLLETKLHSAGIKLEGDSIKQLAQNNKTSPFKIIEILSKK